MCVCVDQFGMGYVDSQTVVCEEIGSEDWLVDIGNDKNPR